MKNANFTEVNANTRALAPTTTPLLGHFTLALRRSLDPSPVAKPRIAADFDQLSELQRITESLRHALLEFEYAVAPGGFLRGWLRFNLLILAILFIPMVLLIPPITIAIEAFESWTEMLFQAAVNILYATLVLLLTLAIIATPILFALVKLRKMRSRPEKYQPRPINKIR